MRNGTIDLGLVSVTKREARECLRMIVHDARELAGQFHGLDRSEKFRTNWPDEYRFANLNWKSFIEATIQTYAALLGTPGVSEHDKDRMYKARLLWELVSKGDPGVERDNRLQLRPNTQQFVGDRYENRKIKERFGVHGNMRAALMNNVALRH